jgi:hypothetical protein
LTLGLVILLLLYVLVSVTPRNSVQPNGNNTYDRAPAKAQTESPIDYRYAHFGDGIHIVGRDIQPGTYRTRSASDGCYYVRLSGFDGSLDQILASENTDSPAVVTIEPADKGFKSSRCATWTQDLSAITASRVTFGDGIFIVGTDIEPGTYRSTGQSGCYYVRLSGFDGSLDQILASENTDSPAVVTIEPADKGFKSSRCATWTQDLSAITASRVTFGDGIFIVGTDIEPGTYRSTGQSGCYYVRLSGFDGSLDQILASENTDSPAVVTIEPVDKGFKSSRCGTWTSITEHDNTTPSQPLSTPR